MKLAFVFARFIFSTRFEVGIPGDELMSIELAFVFALFVFSSRSDVDIPDVEVISLMAFVFFVFSAPFSSFGANGFQCHRGNVSLCHLPQAGSSVKLSNHIGGEIFREIGVGYAAEPVGRADSTLAVVPRMSNGGIFVVVGFVAVEFEGFDVLVIVV